MTSPARSALERALRRPRLGDSPTSLQHRFSAREIADAAAMVRIDLEAIAAAGLRREEWHAFIGRPVASDPCDDITTLVIWTLERGLLERTDAPMPPAPSIKTRSQQKGRRR